MKKEDSEKEGLMSFNRKTLTAHTVVVECYVHAFHFVGQVGRKVT